MKNDAQQVGGAEARPEALADEVEHWTSAHRRHPSAHLGENHDADDADHDHPSQVQLERAPVAELATRSPMSTKPPIADNTPSITPRTFFTARSSRQPLHERTERV